MTRLRSRIQAYDRQKQEKQKIDGDLKQKNSVTLDHLAKEGSFRKARMRS